MVVREETHPMILDVTARFKLSPAISDQDEGSGIPLKQLVDHRKRHLIDEVTSWFNQLQVFSAETLEWDIGIADFHDLDFYGEGLETRSSYLFIEGTIWLSREDLLEGRVQLDAVLERTGDHNWIDYDAPHRISIAFQPSPV